MGDMDYNDRSMALSEIALLAIAESIFRLQG